jgi:mannose-6-phosphate isomerase-like protein (cupin superfamily)
MNSPTAASASIASARPADFVGTNFMITQLDAVTPVPCPCGFARRGFATPENTLATIHLVDIHVDARTHYHKKMTEIYLVLEGEGFIELDGERHPVRPMTSVFIKPGCRHRLVGRFKIVNVPIPAFDPADEWFD